MMQLKSVRPRPDRNASWMVMGLLFSSWFILPVVHQILHLCPVRSDGLNQAEAVPSFARKYGVSCMQCHTAYPTLNAYGRQFKVNGYVRSKGSDEGVMITPDGTMHFDKLFPWGVVVRSRPFDYKNTDTNSGKIQAIQDLDLFVAGEVAKNVSLFAEVDANADSNFSVAAADLQAGYHPYKFLNFLVARRGFFVMDPYQTLSNFGSPTVANRAISGKQTLDQGSLSKDIMDETKQTVAAYGQVGQEGIGSVYYAIGASADKDNDAGNGPKDGSVRLALSTPKDNFMIGTFGSMGKEGSGVPPGVPGTNVQFSKTGVDAMAECGGFVGRGAFLYAFDKDLDAVTIATPPDIERNRAAYLELMYVFNRGDSDTPFLVPLIRQNWYETANGTRQFAYFTAQLAHFFAPNLKAFVEYSADTKQDILNADTTARQPKGSRVTLQAELGF